jgi:hypothetical protein
MVKYFVIFLLGLGLFSFCNIGIAQESTLSNTNPNIDKFDFTMDYINSLGYVKDIYERNLKLGNKNEGSFLGLHDTITQMKIYNTDIYDLEIAKKLIEKYKDSHNPTIQQVVKYVVPIYDQLIEVFQASINILEEMQNNVGSAHPENFNMGVIAKKISVISSTYDECLSSLADATQISALGLISDKPDKDGKMTILGITSEEKSKLIDLLVTKFGEKVKAGVQAGIPEIDVCGGMFYEVLTKKKSLDENQV